MRKEISSEYSLNLKYELETYKHVGRDYGDRKSVNRGLLSNLIRFWRKNISNRKEQKYKLCNTYSEWKNHVKEVIPKNICNYDDFLHFLLFEKKDAETSLETIKVILIPIYVSMLGMTQIFSLDSELSVVTMMIIIAGFSSVLIYNAKRKVAFYEDFIEVGKKEMANVADDGENE